MKWWENGTQKRNHKKENLESIFMTENIKIYQKGVNSMEDEGKDLLWNIEK